MAIGWRLQRAFRKRAGERYSQRPGAVWGFDHEGYDHEMENAKLALARRLTAESLTRIAGQWEIDGDLVRGPGTIAVKIAELHGAEAAHLDFGFVLNRERSDVPIIWDCATGLGPTPEEALRRTVETWSVCTAQVILEMLYQQGQLADHCRGDDPDGFSGWHMIHGPLLAWGVGEGKEELQRWTLEHPLMPRLRTAIEPYLDGAQLIHGIKIFFGGSPGGETAEVRINNVAREEPSAVLLSLDWPRPKGHAYLRAFALLLHEDRGSSGEAH